MEERLTKKERKEARKMEELSKMEHHNNSGNMKWIVIGIAVVLFLGFGIFSIMASKQKKEAPVKISSSGQMMGSKVSNVTLVEFGDFQCPACYAFEPTMQQVRTDYGKSIKIVFKHFPLKQAHPNAMAAAIASEAAAKQGKFWEYHDLLYKNQNTWAPLPDPSSEFVKYAKELTLNESQFKKDLEDKSLAAKIDAQLDEGIKIGVNATPTVYVNGKFMGVPDYNALKKAIDNVLTSNTKKE